MENIQKKNMKQRYVSLLTNGGFKAFFGDENNKEVVRMLINILLPEHRKVVEIDYMPTEHQGPVIGCSKEFHYDFMCRDVTGEVVIVEMQRYRESDWFKRCVSYAGRAYDRQNRSGMDYDVPPVFLIGLMGVDIDHPDKEFWKDRYVSEYTFREKSCGDLLDETICIIFAELTRFRKGEDECETDLDRVLYLIKNSGKMQSPPKWGEELLCRSILDACEIDNFKKDKRKKYDEDMYDERRRNGELKAAREDGIAEGRQAGLAEGKAVAQVEMARNFKSLGVDIETIVKATGLERKEIEAL